MKTKLLILMCMLLFSFAFVSASAPTDYIIYYPMNENSGATVNNLGSFGEDGTSEGINTTEGAFFYTGEPSVNFVNGKIEGGYDFGTYTVFSGGNPEYYNVSRVDTKYDTPLTDGSVFAWVKIKDLNAPTGDGSNILFSQGYEYTGWGLTTLYGELMYYMAGVGGWVTSGLNLQTDVWYHIGFVYNGTNLKLFVNGVEQPFTPEQTNLNPAEGNLTLGWRYHTQPNAPYFGLSNITMDEVKIWDRPLSDTEVAQVYSPATPPTSGGILRYDNLITPEPEEETPAPITGDVVTEPKSSFSISTFFNNIINWFNGLFN